MRGKRKIKRNQFIFIIMMCLVALLVGFVLRGTKDRKPQGAGESTGTPITYSSNNVEVTSKAEASKPEYTPYNDPDNYIYPYNTMSVDTGMELYESGFKYYHIPQEYKDEGGCFPEVVQAYLWSLCEEKGLNYYVVVALIEKESRYHYDASAGNGKIKGYMQIYEKWHKERMEAEGVTDLYNPYENIRVGLNFLEELTGGGCNADYHYVLMSYNLGVSKAKALNKNGIYYTDYSSEILQRAQAIQQELQE